MKKNYLLTIFIVLFLFSCSNDTVENTNSGSISSNSGTLMSSGEISGSGDNTEMKEQLSKELTDDLNEILNLVPNE